MLFDALSLLIESKLIENTDGVLLTQNLQVTAALIMVTNTHVQYIISSTHLISYYELL